MPKSRNYTTDEALEFCLDSDGDSSFGGLETDEEEEIDMALIGDDSHSQFDCYAVVCERVLFNLYRTVFFYKIISRKH